MQASDWDEPSTVLKHTLSPSSRAKATYQIVAIDGCAAGQRWTLTGDSPPAWIGQSHVCAIRLSDPSVSRRHVKLIPGADALHLHDEQSTNGTFVNGVEVSDARLRGGERLQLGDSGLLVERLAQDASQPLPTATVFGKLHGASSEIRCLHSLFDKLAQSDVSLVIEGETGTGKEVLAEALHEMGPRAKGPFVVLDCTAVAPTLLEGALLGHERGAFTGAHAAHPGLLEQAEGGTLFIDEIGDLDISLQPKLLRALERKEVRRLGATASRRFDVRIVCATRRNLDAEVAAGRFRDDLYHRLAVANVELPALHQRHGDIAFLARHFWVELHGDGNAPPPQLLNDWEAQRWPGNVRELRNAVARAIALGHSRYRPRRTTSAPTGDVSAEVLNQDLPLAAARALVVEDFERRYVVRLLQRHDGNVTQAARAAGISRRYLHRLKSRGG